MIASSPRRKIIQAMTVVFSFKEFLKESKEGKNTHLYHLEENIFNGGVVGTREAINFLQSFGKMFSGNSNSRLAITTKVDGAPAVVFGTDPETKKFFVATKHAAFGKVPKLCFTQEDIQTYHGDGGLASKLSIALRFFPSVVKEKAVFQGDLMFDYQSIENTTIDGQKYITFQPNTIVYAVPKDSDLAREILSKKVGIVIHTRYDGGPTISDTKASFKVNADESFKKSPTVWIRDANIRDFSGTATFTKDETNTYYGFLSEAGKAFRKVNAQFLNTIAEDEEINLSILTYNNSKIKKAEPVGDIAGHITGMIEFLRGRYQNQMDKLKTEASKAKIREKSDTVTSFLSKNKENLFNIFVVYNAIMDAKLMLIRKLEQIDKMGKFVRTADGGFRVTSDEGFVATDHLTGTTLKLVDRLEFSFNNFNAIKNWSK